MSETIIWTVIPHGITTDTTQPRRLRLSICASLRFEPEAPKPGEAAHSRVPLNTFMAGNWPEYRKQLRFGLSFGSNSQHQIPIGDTRIQDVTFGPGGERASALRSYCPDAWNTVFPVDEITVKRHKFGDKLKGLSTRGFRSFSANLIHTDIANRYKAIAHRLPELPAIGLVRVNEDDAAESLMHSPAIEASKTLLRSGFEEFRQVTPGTSILLQAVSLSKAANSGMHIMSSSSSRISSAMQAYSAAVDFHAPRIPTLALEPEPLDFHEIVSSLHEYPELLRSLGLIIDIECEIPGFLPTIPKDQAHVSLLVEDTNAEGITGHLGLSAQGSIGGLSHKPTAYHETQETWYEYSADKGILPRSNATQGAYSGLLDISGAEYALAQGDADGAAIKLAEYHKALVAPTQEAASAAATSTAGSITPLSASFSNGLGTATVVTPAVARTVGRPAALPGKLELPPSLSSGGISLLDDSRLLRLQASLQKACQLQQRLVSRMANIIDLQPQRLYAEDLVRGYRVDVLVDNGTPATWRSLCWRKEVYKFGKNRSGNSGVSLTNEGTVTSTFGVGNDKNSGGEDKDHFKVHESMLRWDGWSLTAPRPGRVVVQPKDHATAGSYTAPKAAWESGLVAVELSAVSATAQDPKPTAPLMPPLRFGSKYHLRIRTVDLAGRTLLEANQDASLVATKKDPFPYLRFEPVAAPSFVRLDPALPGESTERLVIRSLTSTENVTGLARTECRRMICPPRTSFEMADRHGCFNLSKKSASDWHLLLKTRHGTDAQLAGTQTSENGKKVVREGLSNEADTAIFTDVVPYLPDSQCSEALLRLLDGDRVVGEALRVPFYTGDTWPDARPFELVLTTGPEGMVLDDSRGHSTVTVSVPAGETRVLRLSSRPRDISVMGIWNWIAQETHGQRRDILEQIVSEGRHWMVSPHRDLMLINALEQPLRVPVINRIHAQRATDASTVSIRTSLALHQPSTARVTLRASWTDVVDDGSTPSGTHESSESGLAGIWPVPAPGDALGVSSFDQPLPDTRRRSVSYSASASSRYADYFIQTPGDKRFHFEGPASATAVVEVPNSGTPTVPDVAYIMPLFEWSLGDASAGLRTSIRKGNTVRVFLRRPWLSTGEGELLGVVLPCRPENTSSVDIPQNLVHLSTQWAKDPIISCAAPGSLASLHEFTDATAKVIGLLPPEIQKVPSLLPKGWQLAVAAHPVHFDAARSLWYADVTLDPGASYYPFVRLALARYQPLSVTNRELSPVVLADFIQLTAGRTLSIAQNPFDSKKVTVTLSGVAPAEANNAARASNWVSVRLEIFRPAPMLELKLTSTPPLEEIGHATTSGTATEREPAQWIPCGEPSELLSLAHHGPSSSVWSGDVVLPEARSSEQTTGGLRMRLIVTEYERHPSRASGNFLSLSLQLKQISRVVYEDVVEL